MKIHTMEQRTPEWYAIRAGKITASMASKLITATGKASTSAAGEIGRILAEKHGLQDPVYFDNEWMERGRELEDEARMWFQVDTGMEATLAGFVESDCGLYGFSPDALLADSNSGLQIKVPSPANHIGYLAEGELPKDYKAQVHFEMETFGASHWWFMSYCPGLPALVVCEERSEYTESLVKYRDKFINRLEEVEAQLFGE